LTVRSAIDLPCLVCLSSRRPLPLAAVNGGTGPDRSSGVEWTDDETRESERGRWSELVSLLVVEAFVLALNCTCCKLQPKDWGLPCMWCTALPGCLPCLVESKCCLSCVGLPLPASHGVGLLGRVCDPVPGQLSPFNWSRLRIVCPDYCNSLCLRTYTI
jgi:hypothetical protein